MFEVSLIYIEFPDVKKWYISRCILPDLVRIAVLKVRTMKLQRHGQPSHEDAHGTAELRGAEAGKQDFPLEQMPQKNPKDGSASDDDG